MNELEIVKYLNQLGLGGWFDGFAINYSKIVFMTILWVLAGLVAIYMDRRKGKWVFLTLILMIIIYYTINDMTIKYGLLKLFPFRERPYVAHPDVIRLLGYPFSDSSFPSGHMSSASGIVTVFMLYYRKIRWIWMIGVLYVFIMALARIHAGVHYPSDIFAGIILGIMYGYLAFYLVGLIRKKWSKTQAGA